MMSLSGKTALITGASRGIGAASARELSRAGASVVLLARSEQSIASIAGEITADGGKALALRCDVASFAAVEAAVRQALAHFGRLDILLNNAGVIEPISPLAESDPAEWDSAIDVNLKGVYHALRAALPVMLEQSGGTIINLSSGAATSAIVGWSQYCAAKAAVRALTRCVHKEYADRGIRIVGLSPGTVATDMQQTIRRSGINPVSQLDWSTHIPPEWPARAVLWLCGNASEYAGEDFSLKTAENRRLVGLPEAQTAGHST